MIPLEQMAKVLDALPDPVFLFSRSGQYIEVFGGRDTRYYHDGSMLVGAYISDLIKAEKADWFLAQISQALDSQQLLIVEYELSNKDVKGLPDEGPDQPIWFEGRIQALDFPVRGEDVVLWVASNISTRHRLEVQLRELCETDQLTGLFNRRKIETTLAQQYDSMLRYDVETAIVVFDLDNLKTVNDKFGHHAGDELICSAAQACRNTLRKTDIACRFGGDEFVIVLPNTSYEQGLHLARRLHDNMQQMRLSVAGHDIALSASVGVVSMTSADASYEAALKRADSALYRAKRSGRNSVVAA